MNGLDIVIIAVITISTAFGLKTGLIKRAFSLLAIVLGLFIASRIYVQCAGILENVIHNPNVCKGLSFAIIFILVAIAITVIGRLVKGMVNLLLLGWVDRIGGAVLGLVGTAILVGAILLVVTKFPIAGLENWIQDSKLAPLFVQFVQNLWKLVPHDF